MSTVRILQLTTHEEFDLDADEAALRVPYEVDQHTAPLLECGDGTVVYEDDPDGPHYRVAPAHLGECHPGEHVLVQFDPPAVDEAGWWLCQVESLDGDDVASS